MSTQSIYLSLSWFPKHLRTVIFRLRCAHGSLGDPGQMQMLIQGVRRARDSISNLLPQVPLRLLARGAHFEGPSLRRKVHKCTVRTPVIRHVEHNS